MSAIPGEAPPAIRLSRSREQLQELFEEPESNGDSPNHHFPRSKVMRLFAGNRSLALLALGAGGLLLFKKPALVMRTLRLIPMSAVMRMVVARFMSRGG